MTAFLAKFPNYKKFISTFLICPIGRWYSSGTGSGRQNQGHRPPPKILPALMYVHNPIKYVQNKMQLWRLRAFWDRSFVEKEFIRGTKMAAVVMTDIIRNQEAFEIGHFTTPLGFQQIIRDMILSRNDPRLQLINFRNEDIQRAIPIRVVPRKRDGRKQCVVDMLFVAMRNLKDFQTQELPKIKQCLEKYDFLEGTDRNDTSAAHRIIFSEIFIRFYRDYTPQIKDDWSISFYRVISFNILNYHPIQ